jgi:hypothetical protein
MLNLGLVASAGTTVSLGRRCSKRGFALSIFLCVTLFGQAGRVVALAAVLRGVTVLAAPLAEGTVAGLVIAIIQVSIGMPADAPFVVVPAAQLFAFLTFGLGLAGAGATGEVV